MVKKTLLLVTVHIMPLRTNLRDPGQDVIIGVRLQYPTQLDDWSLTKVNQIIDIMILAPDEPKKIFSMKLFQTWALVKPGFGSAVSISTLFD